MVRKLKNFLKNWRKFLFGFLTIWIIYLNLKVHYLEYLNKQWSEYNSTEDDSDESEYAESENDPDESEYAESENDSDESEYEIQKLKDKIDSLEAILKLNKRDFSNILFEDIFWDIGKYVPKNKNTFFTSPGCEKKDVASPNWFISKRWIYYDRFNTNWTYAYLTDIGYVWTSSEVSFKEYSKK